jgi:phosphoribosylanthranilate isomerase
MYARMKVKVVVEQVKGDMLRMFSQCSYSGMQLHLFSQPHRCESVTQSCRLIRRVEVQLPLLALPGGLNNPPAFSILAFHTFT